MGASNSTPMFDLPAVAMHNIETSTEKRTRTLKHLLRANHVNHSVLFHNLTFHNHMAHILGSAWMLGADADHLNIIYESESKDLEPWVDAPGEVSRHDWQAYLGKPEYQRGFIDFWEDELVRYGYDWKQLMNDYLFEGDEPLINNLICGLAHPLIQLGYAYELQSREIGIEALVGAATCHNFLHKYLDDPIYTKPSSYCTTSLIEILRKVQTDDRLNGLLQSSNPPNMAEIYEDQEDSILEHWNAWELPNPKQQFEHSQRAAVLLLLATHQAGQRYFDFYLVHLLTSSHAVRTLLPLIPEEYQISLVRQWWLITLTLYIRQHRPSIKEEVLKDYDLKGRDWKWAENEALTSKHAVDAHFVKAIRAMKDAADLWGDDDHWYLKAAVQFASDFNGWGGFEYGE